jgi:hypothetical protein
MNLTLSVPLGQSPDALLQQVRERFLAHSHVIAVATIGRGSGIEATYAVRLHPGAAPTELVDALNALEGIQSVRLERDRRGGAPSGFRCVRVPSVGAGGRGGFLCAP